MRLSLPSRTDRRVPLQRNTCYYIPFDNLKLHPRHYLFSKDKHRAIKMSWDKGVSPIFLEVIHDHDSPQWQQKGVLFALIVKISIPTKCPSHMLSVIWIPRSWSSRKCLRAVTCHQTRTRFKIMKKVHQLIMPVLAKSLDPASELSAVRAVTLSLTTRYKLKFALIAFSSFFLEYENVSLYFTLVCEGEDRR